MLHGARPVGWEARLELDLRKRGRRTVLVGRRHRGPLQVQRPFYPETDACHVYVLHPPGGLVGGDALQIRVRVGANAAVLLTTPAAGKIYRSEGPTCVQDTLLAVANGASLESLPQENIVFDSGRVRLRTRVLLAPRARYIGWDIVCLGRPAAGERFTRGYQRQSLEIWRKRKPLLVERACFEGGSSALRAAWGLAGFPVTGTLAAVPATADDVKALRRCCESEADSLFAVTLLGEVLVCRCLAMKTAFVRRTFTRAWELLRPPLLGRAACAPRVWSS